LEPFLMGPPFIKFWDFAMVERVKVYTVVQLIKVKLLLVLIQPYVSHS